MLYICVIQYDSMFTWNVTGASEELNFYIYLIVINL